MLTERRQVFENTVDKLDSSDDEFTLQKSGRKFCASPIPARNILEDDNDDEDERCARRKSRLLEPHPTNAHSPRPNETSSRRRSDAAAPRGISQAQLGEHYGNCIRLAAENKITAKNAFNLHLIDYMSDMLKNEDYASFQIASSSLDAGAKIYAGRVDAVHQETYQVLTGLGRSDKAPTEDNAEDGNGGEFGTENTSRPDQPRKAQPHRDIIQKQLGKIRSKALAAKVDVDPLFQHQTSAYDDGGTVELRLNQLRSLDETCTLILDSSTPVIQSVQQTSTEAIDVRSLTGSIHLVLPNMVSQLVLCPSLRSFRFTDWDVNQHSPTRLSQPSSPAPSAGGQQLFPELDVDDHYSDHPPEDDTLVANDDEIDRLVLCGTANAAAAERVDNDIVVRVGSPTDPSRTEPDTLAESELFVSSLKSMLGKQYEHFGQLNDHLLGMWAGPEHWRKKAKRRKFDPITGLEVTSTCLSRTDLDDQNKEQETEVVGKDRRSGRQKKSKVPKVIYAATKLQSENRTRSGNFARKSWSKAELSEGIPNSAASNATVYKEQYRLKASKQLNLLPSQWTDVRQTMYQLHNREVIVEPNHCSESHFTANVSGMELGDMITTQTNAELLRISGQNDPIHTDAMDIVPSDDESPDSPICINEDDDDMALPFQGAFTQFTNANGDFTATGGLDLISQPRKVARIEIDYARTAKMINVRRLKMAMWNFLEVTLKSPLNGACSPFSAASTSSAPEAGSLTRSPIRDLPHPVDGPESLMSPRPEESADSKVPSFRTLIGGLSSRISWQMAKELSIPIAFNCLLHLANEKDLYLEPHPTFSDIFISQGLPESELESLKPYQLIDSSPHDEIGPDGSIKRHSRQDNARNKKAKRHRPSTLDSWLIDEGGEDPNSPG